MVAVDGVDEVNANAELVVTDTDGNDITVSLTTDLSGDDGTALAALINTALGANGSAAFAGGEITITDDDNIAGSFSVALDGTPVTGTSTAGVADVAAVAAVTFTVSDLTIQVGDGSEVAVANATYDSIDDFVAAINTALGGNATASLDDDNVLTISSSETITIGGANAGTVFTATEFAASGSLTTVNVNSVDAANDAIRRIDSALTSVSDLRSTFGAIQNRFESTIANLGSTVENLSASRSRILDADFAAETANLTRAQILQQAGISILSQANALPQTVLGLLG
jgi:flagellin